MGFGLFFYLVTRKHFAADPVVKLDNIWTPGRSTLVIDKSLMLSKWPKWRLFLLWLWSCSLQPVTAEVVESWWNRQWSHDESDRKCGTRWNHLAPKSLEPFPPLNRRTRPCSCSVSLIKYPRAIPLKAHAAGMFEQLHQLIHSQQFDHKCWPWWTLTQISFAYRICLEVLSMHWILILQNERSVLLMRTLMILIKLIIHFVKKKKGLPLLMF